MKRFFTGPAIYDTKTSELRLATQEEINVLTVALNDPDSVRTPIRYEEALPAFNMRVLAWHGNQWITAYRVAFDWFDDNHKPIDGTITAWMPLPAPYKEDV